MLQQHLLEGRKPAGLVGVARAVVHFVRVDGEIEEPGDLGDGVVDQLPVAFDHGTLETEIGAVDSGATVLRLAVQQR